MKKTKILITALCLLIGACAGAQTFEYPTQLQLEGVVGLYTEDLEDAIPRDTRVVLVLFNPGCGHCIDFIDSTIAAYDDFEDLTFVYIYGDNEELDKTFARIYDVKNLAAYPKFVFAKSPNEDYFDQYRLKSLPTVFLYDSGKKHKHIKPIALVEGDYGAFIKEIIK